MILAIDLDDTIHDPQNRLPGYRMGQPIKGAIMSMQRLRTQGHRLIIFTARDVRQESAYKAVADWLDHFGIPYDGITNIKRPEFDLFIDNRSLHFEDWARTMFKLDSMNKQELDTFTHEAD